MTSQAQVTGGNVILIRTAAITLLIALVLAWCLVLSKGYKIPPFVTIFSNNDKLLAAHLDFLMMTMLLLGFYGARVPLPRFVQWPMAIGSITNPTVFLIKSTSPQTHLTELEWFALVSITLTTIGYAMGAIRLFRSTLR